MRVVQRLIDILRASGYPGYESDGINAADKVARRMHEQYTQVYGEATFTPAAVAQAVRVRETTLWYRIKWRRRLKRSNSSIHGNTQQDRPTLSQRGARRAKATSMRTTRRFFAKYGNVNITTGSTMTQQFAPW